MALVAKDGFGSTQNLPNSGIDTAYGMTDNGTVTSSNTSATDVYQATGAAGIVARIRRVEVLGTVVIATATSVAADSTLCRLMRRTAVGTVGVWTVMTEAAGQIGRLLASASAASVVWSSAGTAAMTVGAGTQILRQGIVCHPSLRTVTNIASAPAGTPLVWDFGVNGMAPCYLVGAADFLDINLNAVTPVGTLAVNVFWDEATA